MPKLPTPQIALPPELQAFLADHAYACVSQQTSDGTVLVVKIPSQDIESCRGRQQILVRYELYTTAHGPALRLLLAIHDVPGAPLKMETFCNVGDPVQLAEYRDLLSRAALRVLFYDEALEHRLSKVIPQPSDPATEALIPEALTLLKRTDPSLLDFDKAKAIIVDEVPL
jgi:hypothetical protein